MNIPDTIYHYCSPEVAFTILRDRTLWLSSISNLNDYSEIVWAQRIIDEQLAEIKDKVPDKDIESLRNLLYLNRGLFFICCFSEEGDILSQWRAYAGDGKGVAIGFDPKKLITENDIHWGTRPNNLPGIAICKVQYEEAMQKKTVRDILDRWALGPDGGLSQSAHGYLNALQIKFKNPAFAEEKEHRLVTSPAILLSPDDGEPIPPLRVIDLNPVSELKHRCMNGKVTAYFETKFQAEAITSVVLGPKNEFAQFDFESFLSLNGLRHVEVSASTATYRS